VQCQFDQRSVKAYPRFSAKAAIRWNVSGLNRAAIARQRGWRGSRVPLAIFMRASSGREGGWAAGMPLRRTPASPPDRYILQGRQWRQPALVERLAQQIGRAVREPTAMAIAITQRPWRRTMRCRNGAEGAATRPIGTSGRLATLIGEGREGDCWDEAVVGNSGTLLPGDRAALQ
jgi:hypothetical protein